MESGAGIADPSASMKGRMVIRRGGFSPVRNRRKGDFQTTAKGGFTPAANHTSGNLDKLLKQRYGDPSAGAATMDRMEPAPAFVGLAQAELARGGIISAHMDSLAGGVAGGLISAGPKQLGVITNKTLSGSMPRITYSPVPNTSKSYTATSAINN